MKKQIGVFTIHGIGSQKAGFSAGLVEQLCQHLGKLRSRFQWEEIHWANVMKVREDILLECMKDARDQDGAPLKLDWMSARNFVVNGFGDALAYHRDFEKDSAYSVIHQVISSTIENFYSTCAARNTPVVVLAHSLGCHMMSNYLWDTQQRGYKGPLAPLPGLVGFVTFGCNIPLFSLAFPSARPIRLPSPNIRKHALRTAAKWLNFYDRDDLLGWPLRPLYQKNFSKLTKAQRDTVSRMVDYEINVGSLATSWNPAAHNGYWTDRDMTLPIAQYLGKLVDALDA